MTNPSDTTTPTAADVLTKLQTSWLYESVNPSPELAMKRLTDQAAHQLYLAELERIGDDEKHSNGSKMVNPEVCVECDLPEEAYTRNRLRKELRERARIYYGQEESNA